MTRASNLERNRNWERMHSKASICLYGQVFDSWDDAFNIAKKQGYNGSAFRLKRKYFKERPATWSDLTKKAFSKRDS